MTNIQSTKGNIDKDGVCWTDREFSHPERTIRIATTFSGIGAPEQALKRLGLKSECVFACDIGERYLKYTYRKLFEFTKGLSDEDKILFAQHLYNGNKAQKESLNEKRKRKGEDTIPFTYEAVYSNLYIENTDKTETLELVKECIDMLTSGMSHNETERYINHLYDGFGENRVKKSFFANYDITEERWHNDIRFLDVTPYKGQVDLYVGGSPCQAYSQSGKRLGLEDTRGTLFYDFARTIKECQPKVFIFENVKGMLSCGNGEKSGLEAAVDVFEGLGYDIHWQLLDAKDYGIPQHRERIWLIGFKEKTEFLFPMPIPLTTRMYDYLDDDIPPRSGKVDEPYTRYLTSTECLRLMGFKNFNRVVSNRDLCAQAGNSMVVDCIMALFKQMDITKYGVEL